MLSIDSRLVLPNLSNAFKIVRILIGCFAFLSQVNLVLDVEKVLKALESTIGKNLVSKKLKETVPLNQYNERKGFWYGWYVVPISEEDIKTALKPKKVILRVSLDHICLCFPKEEIFERKFIFIFSPVLVKFPM